MSKRLSKYIASFNYFDKSLIVLSGTSSSISIALFGTVIGAPVGLASACFSFAFSITTGIVKKSHTCEESGAHLRICLAFTGELEKQLFTKKTVEMGP